MTRPRATRLTLQAFEDRCTPATFAYAAATQTLTVIAAHNDQIDVNAQIASKAGHVNVSANGDPAFFNSAAGDGRVKNLVVRFDGVDSGQLSLSAWVHLPGNLSVFGARSAQTFIHSAEVDGTVRYMASGSATDDVTVNSRAEVNKNMTLSLGEGENTLRLKGGTVGGRLLVTGGKDADTVELMEFADLTVGGSAAFRLGDGPNKIRVVDQHRFDVLQDLSYVGGAGRDQVRFHDYGNLRIGGQATFNLGSSPPDTWNSLAFNTLAVAGNLFVAGGTGGNSVNFYHGLTVGGNLTADLRGDNYFSFDMQSSFEREIDGRLTYKGGNGQDQVAIDAVTIGRDLSVALGDSPNDDQFFRIGTKYFKGSRVHGSVSVTAGSSNEEIILRRLIVDKGLTLKTGDGDDAVEMDAVEVIGRALFELGSGEDTLKIALRTQDNEGDLDDYTTFRGRVTVRAGAGDDAVYLSENLDWPTYAQFKDRIDLVGGAGIDQLVDIHSKYAVNTNTEDFEMGDFQP